MHEMTKEDMHGNDYTVFHGIFLEELDNTTDRLRTVDGPTEYGRKFLEKCTHHQ
jgi:hypothetical protein